ncbi:hypothetical protein Rsub_03372 [Raphidocelis subcapitata]|uniref:Uncharacterized protein n=1 Tax=Raphidocelis subcapitata TaxID=307507 RepID=A0A2V0NSD6_9CHLO|nr:hypothetical protein Rsub_03372 [Raphidocelis subcapitata]|eukprot:GBF90239.1 hypothetical protein Rsub_03372 [Raphidocelis subcapitata]
MQRLQSAQGASRQPFSGRAAPPRPAVRARAVSGTPLPLQAQQSLKRELAEALSALPGLDGLFPGAGDAQTKARVCSIVEELERIAPFRADTPGAAASLLGNWSLAFASSGTVVTRSPAAQLLAQMAALPGFGISNIGQQLDPATPLDPAAGNQPAQPLAGAGVKCSNQMRLNLGPMGSWQVRVMGHWQSCHNPSWRFAGTPAPRGRPADGDADGPGLASEVLFDGLGVQLQGVLGLPIQLPELTLSVPRRPPNARPNFRTTYVDPDTRVGRGVDSGSLFVFRKDAA